MRSTSRRSSGFTLMEVMIALGILAMVLAVATPAGARMYENMQYRSAVRDVMSTLNAARISAVSGGTAQDVLVRPRQKQMVAGGKTSQLPASVEVQVLGAAELNRDEGGVIRFYPDGSASGGAVGLTSPQGKLTELQVDWLLGRVDLCESDCGSFD